MRPEASYEDGQVAATLIAHEHTGRESTPEGALLARAGALSYGLIRGVGDRWPVCATKTASARGRGAEVSTPPWGHHTFATRSLSGVILVA